MSDLLGATALRGSCSRHRRPCRDECCRGAVDIILSCRAPDGQTYRAAGTGRLDAHRCQHATHRIELGVAGRSHRCGHGVGGFGEHADQPLPELSEREREILDLMSRHYTNPEIAQQLGIGDKTIRNHVSNIFNKLPVTTRAQAIDRARQAGLGEGHDHTGRFPPG